MKLRITLAIAAGAIWLFCFAPAYAQGLTEYLGTTGQSAAGQNPARSLGSALGNQLRGAGQAIDSGNNAPSYDSNSEDQGQALDSSGNSGPPTGPSGGSEDNYDDN